MVGFERFKNIIVTGGAGFIGSNLIDRLLKVKNLNLHIIDKISYSSDLGSLKELIDRKSTVTNSKCKLYQINLSNYKDTEKAVLKANPDLIFHLAAESHVDRSIDEPYYFIESNFLGTFNLLECAKNHWQKLSQERKNLFKFIHISTDEVFGSLNKSGKFNEKTSYNPSSPYSASKAGSDHLVNAWNKTYGLPTIVSNCSNNYGPRQFPEKLIPLVILKLLKEEEIPLFGDGKNVRDWLFVEDHIEALLTIADSGVVGEKYCIGGSNEITNRELVEKICQIFDQKFPYNSPHKRLIKYVEDRPGHDFRYSIDSSKIKKSLGWEEKYKFVDGINKTIDWYLANLNWCERLQQKTGYKGQRLGLEIKK